ncbi:BTB/POZ domain-containing protein KCTD7-like [Haliotis rufescens]|uniref:BTB/POZ domain-containing protein KCTD7-like n=1 Tax=Haliotis rufescens TaxID=6454 RepID=UPI00201F0A4F|nr:BTB/POZ domain-containing protein KCTD7-like [Haliotis rufescens]
MEFPAVIDLNVGGRHLTTCLSTLTKYPDSMLAGMFSGRHPVAKDKDGRYFIDVDGDVFVHVLNFLRFETVPPVKRAKEVRKYAEYFGLRYLPKAISESYGYIK